MDTTSCPVCGAANRPDARFCSRCGAALAKLCPQCNAYNRLSAQFCIRCGAKLAVAPVAQEAPTGPAVKSGAAAPVATGQPTSLRLLEVNTWPGFGRSGGNPLVGPVNRFSATDTAFHIRLRFANLDPMRQHSHRLFVQFFRPNGRLHLSRERPELLVAPAGQAEVETTIFGLRLAGAEAVKYPGMWRAVVYLDEEKLAEIPFEIEG